MFISCDHWFTNKKTGYRFSENGKSTNETLGFTPSSGGSTVNLPVNVNGVWDIWTPSTFIWNPKNWIRTVYSYWIQYYTITILEVPKLTNSLDVNHPKKWWSSTNAKKNKRTGFFRIAVYGFTKWYVQPRNWDRTVYKTRNGFCSTRLIKLNSKNDRWS